MIHLSQKWTNEARSRVTSSLSEWDIRSTSSHSSTHRVPVHLSSKKAQTFPIWQVSFPSSTLVQRESMFPNSPLTGAFTIRSPNSRANTRSFLAVTLALTYSYNISMYAVPASPTLFRRSHSLVQIMWKRVRKKKVSRATFENKKCFCKAEISNPRHLIRLAFPLEPPLRYE